MTSSHLSVTWGSIVVEALAAAGIRRVCVCPGSRSTPLVLPAYVHDNLEVISLLDERSAGFFAVGYAKAAGKPTALISTSGTATANFHPAVLEADESRSPLIVCTADRPPELHEAGANQTIDQTNIFGDAVRWAPTISPPTDDANCRASLWTTVTMAVERSRGHEPGPVHLNIPFRKPLEPPSLDHIPSLEDAEKFTAPRVRQGTITPSDSVIDELADTVEAAHRGLIVLGPHDPCCSFESFYDLAAITGFPLLVDPLSGCRYDAITDDVIRCGGYDSYLSAQVSQRLSGADLIVRAGARPTSKRLQQYLNEQAATHVYIDSQLEYRDPRYATTDIINADPQKTVAALTTTIGDVSVSQSWQRAFEQTEDQYWETVSTHGPSLPAEGRIAHMLIDRAPADSTIFVSNSMPIRDVDRFGAPRQSSITMIGNRGVSGIDGILSTGLGVGAVHDDPIIFCGDLALYHDMNGLLAIDRTSVDPTIVVVNNDGGGIFHALPIESIEPPFSELFKTPHGLDFSHVADLYGLSYCRCDVDQFESAYLKALNARPSLVEVAVDAETSHRDREKFDDLVKNTLTFS